MSDSNTELQHGLVEPLSGCCYSSDVLKVVFEHSEDHQVKDTLVEDDYQGTGG